MIISSRSYWVDHFESILLLILWKLSTESINEGCRCALCSDCQVDNQAAISVHQLLLFTFRTHQHALGWLLSKDFVAFQCFQVILDAFRCFWITFGCFLDTFDYPPIPSNTLQWFWIYLPMGSPAPHRHSDRHFVSKNRCTQATSKRLRSDFRTTPMHHGVN